MIRDVALLIMKLLMELLSGDDSAKFWWKERVVLSFLRGFTNPLHVAARWQTLPQDGFAQ